MTLKEFQNLINSKQKHFVELGADWCPPCKVLKKTIHTILEKYPHLEKQIHIVDIDHAEELVEAFGASSLPSIFYIKEGNFDLEQGIQQEKTILDFLNP